MRIVVTGLSGNLGTALLRRLATTHQHEVVGIVRRPPSGGEPYEAASWVALDLADGSAESGLRRAFTGADAVVHLAWEFQPSHDVDYMDRGTVGGTAAVLSAADAAGVAHLVHLSSLGVYSPAPRAASDGTPARVDEDYPRDGISSLSYSREKVAAERLLDDYEAVPATGHRVAITRIRPGIVMQRAAASAILRYTTPPWLPSRVLRHVPVLPLDRSLTFPGVHADDVAAALVAVLEQRATGAFNLAAEPPITTKDVAAALGARVLHVPMPLVRGAAALTWRARVQPLDPGWLDLAAAVPLLDTGRARSVLGWEPTVDAQTALAELIEGMADAAGTTSPALRRRSVLEGLRRLVTRGPVSGRRLP